MDRRGFLLHGARLGAASAVLTPVLGTGAGAQPPGPSITVGPGPYGSLEGREPDENGLVLPEGFTARVVARSGEEVPGTGLVYPGAPDGAACFPDPDEGGWFHVRNAELFTPEGGVTALRFSAEGEITDAYWVCEETSRNCAGGPTPWGTWLSGEEVPDGEVWECDPSGGRPAESRPTLGVFQHESIAVDPVGEALYLTEDQPDGRFYRFTPSAYPALDDGVLEAAVVAGDGAVTWSEVPDPTSVDPPTRTQVGASMPFNGGEGCWYDPAAERVLFTTKGDNRVWSYDPAAEQLVVLYDASTVADAPLTGVDNIVVTSGGDAYVAEDGGNMELVLLTPEGTLDPFLRFEGHDGSEVTGPCFSPDGSRLYVASQRGTDGRGIVYEINGPFRDAEAPGGATTTLEAAAGESTETAAGDDATEGGDGAPVGLIAGIGVALAAAGGAVLALRGRRGAASR